MCVLWGLSDSLTYVCCHRMLGTILQRLRVGRSSLLWPLSCGILWSCTMNWTWVVTCAYFGRTRGTIWSLDILSKCNRISERWFSSSWGGYPGQNRLIILWGLFWAPPSPWDFRVWFVPGPRGQCNVSALLLRVRERNLSLWRTLDRGGSERAPGILRMSRVKCSG